MAERWNLAELLWSKNYSYREISDLTGASTTTVGKVATSYFKDNNGYQNLINRMEKL